MADQDDVREDTTLSRQTDAPGEEERAGRPDEALDEAGDGVTRTGEDPPIETDPSLAGNADEDVERLRGG